MKKIYFSTNLKYLRQQKGMTQKELGKALNVSEQVISHWEKGIREPNSIEKISEIADIFNTDEKLLFTDLRINDNKGGD